MSRNITPVVNAMPTIGDVRCPACNKLQAVTEKLAGAHLLYVCAACNHWWTAACRHEAGAPSLPSLLTAMEANAPLRPGSRPIASPCPVCTQNGRPMIGVFAKGRNYYHCDNCGTSWVHDGDGPSAKVIPMPPKRP